MKEVGHDQVSVRLANGEAFLCTFRDIVYNKSTGEATIEGRKIHGDDAAEIGDALQHIGNSPTLKKHWGVK